MQPVKVSNNYNHVKAVRNSNNHNHVKVVDNSQQQPQPRQRNQ